jgi:hypothetical protein
VAFRHLARCVPEAAHVVRLLGAFLAAAGPGVGLAALASAVWNDPAAVFSDLGPAADAREREGRRQAGLAITIYRRLLRNLPPEVALAVMRPLLAAGGLAFLASALSDLSPEALARATTETLGPRVRGWLDRFATATAAVVEASPGRVVFDVHACALVRLCAAAGHPELAPLFCESDAAFFPHRGVRLDRPTTLATGGPRCRFILTPA